MTIQPTNNKNRTIWYPNAFYEVWQEVVYFGDIYRLRTTSKFFSTNFADELSDNIWIKIAQAGDASAANQLIEIGLLTSIDNKTPNLGQATMGGSVPVVIASNQSPVEVDLPGVSTAVNQVIGNASLAAIEIDTNSIDNKIPAQIDGRLPVGNVQSAAQRDFAPGYGPGDNQLHPLITDPSNNLQVRSQVTTDEGSFRANFSGVSLSISVPNGTFIAGDTTVTFASSIEDFDVHLGDYIKRDADGESAWTQIAKIISFTEVELAVGYLGTSGTSATSATVMKPVTGAGATISVSNGSCVIASGTTDNAITEIERKVDYPPLLTESTLSISQRITAQDIYFGFYDEANPTNPWFYAWFRFSGTNPRVVLCESASSKFGPPFGGEVEATTATIPGQRLTSQQLRYRIELSQNFLFFYINDEVVARHTKAMPRPHDFLTSTVRIVNGVTPATSTTVTVDYVSGENYNLIQSSAEEELPSSPGGAMPMPYGQYLPVRPLPTQISRFDFANVVSGGIDDTFLQIINSVGTGQTVNQTGGNLVLTTGTTSRAETIIRSRQPIRGSFELRYLLTMSQRISNNLLYVELVDVLGDALPTTIIDATNFSVTFPRQIFTSQNIGQSVWFGKYAGTGTFTPGRYAINAVAGNVVTFTGASMGAGAGTISAFGRNYYNLAYQGTTATQTILDSGRQGWAAASVTATINTTASPGHIGILTNNDAQVAYQDQLAASVATIQQALRAVRNTNIPDLDVDLYFQIRMHNSVATPASSTTHTFGFVSLKQDNTQPVEISSVRPNTLQSLPVDITRSVVLSAAQSGTWNVGLNAGTNLAADVGHQVRANSTGAATTSPVNSPATPAGQNIKGSAGRIYGYQLTNNGAATRYVKFFNATSVTMGVTSALFEVAISVGQTASVSFAQGLAFGTGIQIAVTGGRGLLNNTAITLDDVTGFVVFS